MSQDVEAVTTTEVNGDVLAAAWRRCSALPDANRPVILLAVMAYLATAT